jgi:hypothetical protein
VSPLEPGILEIMEAMDAGIDDHAYDELAKVDIPHPEIMALHEHGFDFTKENWRALRESGISCTEMCEALEANIDVYEYSETVNAGIPHAEIMALQKRGFDFIENWPAIREDGITCAEMCEAMDANLAYEYYASSRRAGATHSDVMDVLRAPAHVWTYELARKDGLSHEAAMEHAVQAGGSSYWPLHKLGYEPYEILEIDEVTNGDYEEYLKLITAGYDHNEAIDRLLSL